MQTAETEQLQGTVVSITYRNERNGYTVLQLASEGRLITAVGAMPAASPGDSLLLEGSFTTHKTYGSQFQVTRLSLRPPQTAEAVLTFLSSGAIKGVGPATAAKIVDLFGDRTLEVLEKEPARLAQVRGITLKKAKEIGAQFAERYSMRELMLRFSAYGLSAVESLRILEALGAECVEQVEQNPYLLCREEIGFAFDRADAMAAGLGLSPLLPARLESGALHVLRHNAGNGHTCLPRHKVCEVAARLLRVEPGEVDAAVDRLLADGRAVERNLSGRPFVALPLYYECEQAVCDRLRLMLAYPPAPVEALPQRLEALELATGIHYDERQKAAVFRALSDGVLVLTGGPGTGKTTTIQAIITLLQGQNLKVALAAPTGRAAKRMSELTGGEAKTLHRLLEVAYSDEQGAAEFGRNERHPLEADAVIVDELSMVDVQLFDALLRAMPLGCRLIMVGDENQLPAVGAGNVLGDILVSGLVPVVSLHTIFRQAMQSRIVTNAHKIVAGETPDLTCRDGDFFLAHAPTPRAAAALLCDLDATRLPAAYGLDPLTDIQILCPSRMGETGSVHLNQLLCERLNPAGAGKREWTGPRGLLRVGDKVMQTRNNYDVAWTRADGAEGTGVWNGDVGLLLSLDPATGVATVRFDDRVAVYAGEDWADLEQAYAITVHKSQGSEYPCVLIPVIGIPQRLAYRNLLYTGVTRARRLLVLAGEERTVAHMVQNHVKSRRYTMLAHLLTESASPPAES